MELIKEFIKRKPITFGAAIGAGGLLVLITVLKIVAG